MKYTKIMMDDEMHSRFKQICAREKVFMQEKCHELVRDYLKNLKETRQIINS
jgi:hypothetical protein